MPKKKWNKAKTDRGRFILKDLTIANPDSEQVWNLNDLCNAIENFSQIIKNNIVLAHHSSLILDRFFETFRDDNW